MAPAPPLHAGAAVSVPAQGGAAFAAGRVVADAEGDVVCVEVAAALGAAAPGAQAEVLRVPRSQVRPRAPLGDEGCADNTSLVHLNDASILENLSLRHRRDQIYTYTASVLLAVNPYRRIGGLYGDEQCARYRGRPLGALAPHPYAIAEAAHRSLVHGQRSQSLLISGESGAGKTETAKIVTEYLAYASRQAGGARPELASHIQARVVQAQPILESFGNAITISRSYHCFYEMLAGLSDQRLSALELSRHPEEGSMHGQYRLLHAGGPSVGVEDRTTAPTSPGWRRRSGPRASGRIGPRGHRAAARGARAPRGRRGGRARRGGGRRGGARGGGGEGRAPRRGAGPPRVVAARAGPGRAGGGAEAQEGEGAWQELLPRGPAHRGAVPPGPAEPDQGPLHAAVRGHRPPDQPVPPRAGSPSWRRGEVRDGRRRRRRRRPAAHRRPRHLRLRTPGAQQFRAALHQHGQREAAAAVRGAGHARRAGVVQARGPAVAGAGSARRAARRRLHLAGLPRPERQRAAAGQRHGHGQRRAVLPERPGGLRGG
ncbi:unnamed protein product, partial [Prorocentrum cordatum]